MVLCEFCNSQNNCKHCCSKKFPFFSESNGDLEESQQVFGQICKICETKIYIKKFHEEVDTRVQNYKHKKVNKQQELKIVQAKQVTWK